jgi:2-dehydro-3-deoxyphosphogluconate aldolase / (4S)-4-hydroxy-2-oxoglutarate aldolase
VDVLQAIRSDRAVAVIRGRNVADPAGLAATFADAGIRAIEFTFTIPGALAAIEAAAGSGALVGAGTVRDERQARDALSAGAQFLVSPACVAEVAQVAHEAGVPVFLGGLTPTEVDAALKARTTAVKLFPAGLGGPQYLRDLRGPFPDVAFVPSGGVSEENARAFLDAGAIAVYAGSRLAPPDLVEAGDHAEIGRRARAFIAALRCERG